MEIHPILLYCKKITSSHFQNKNELEKSSKIKTLQVKTTGVKQINFWRCLQVSDTRCYCRSYGPLSHSQYRLCLGYPTTQGTLFAVI